MVVVYTALFFIFLGPVNPSNTEHIGISNNVAFSIWKDFIIEINGKQVNAGNEHYVIQSHLQLLLNMSPESVPKWSVCGVYGDTNMTQLDPNQASGDPEIKRRCARYAQGKFVRLFSPLLSCGPTQTSRLLPALTTLKLKYFKSDPAFHVTHANTISGEFYLHIKELCLHLKR